MTDARYGKFLPWNDGTTCSTCAIVTTAVGERALAEIGWRAYNMRRDEEYLDAKGRKKTRGWVWIEHECADCAAGLLARAA